MNPRRLRLTAFVVSGAGLIFLTLAFVLGFGPGSIVSLIGVILMVAGVWLTLGYGRLKAKESKK